MILRNMKISQEYEIFVELANFCFVGTIILCFKIAKNFAGNQFCNFFRQQNVNKQESTTFFF